VGATWIALPTSVATCYFCYLTIHKYDWVLSVRCLCHDRAHHPLCMYNVAKLYNTYLSSSPLWSWNHAARARTTRITEFELVLLFHTTATILTTTCNTQPSTSLYLLLTRRRPSNWSCVHESLRNTIFRTTLSTFAQRLLLKPHFYLKISDQTSISNRSVWTGYSGTKSHDTGYLIASYAPYIYSLTSIEQIKTPRILSELLSQIISLLPFSGNDCVSSLPCSFPMSSAKLYNIIAQASQF
jgi:hypothetical protein